MADEPSPLRNRRLLKMSFLEYTMFQTPNRLGHTPLNFLTSGEAANNPHATTNDSNNDNASFLKDIWNYMNTRYGEKHTQEKNNLEYKLEEYRSNENDINHELDVLRQFYTLFQDKHTSSFPQLKKLKTDESFYPYLNFDYVLGNYMTRHIPEGTYMTLATTENNVATPIKFYDGSYYTYTGPNWSDFRTLLFPHAENNQQQTSWRFDNQCGIMQFKLDFEASGGHDIVIHLARKSIIQKKATQQTYLGRITIQKDGTFCIQYRGNVKSQEIKGISYIYHQKDEDERNNITVNVETTVVGNDPIKILTIRLD